MRVAAIQIWCKGKILAKKASSLVLAEAVIGSSLVNPNRKRRVSHEPRFLTSPKAQWH